MFCPACGKPISDESIFCMFCGKGIPGKTPQISSNRSIMETPPVGIDNIYFWLEGPTEVQRGGLFSDTKIGRGFCTAFSLIDASGNWTVSNGQLILALIWAFNYSTNRQLGTDSSALREAKKKAIFYEEINIKKSDFRWGEFHNSSREWEELHYTYSRITPLLFARREDSIFLHLWFRTPDGKLLYKTGEWVTWE